MIFNLQHFAQVIDAQGNILEKEKPKVKPKAKVNNTVVPSLPTPVVTAPAPVDKTQELDPIGTGNNKMPDFLVTSPEQAIKDKERSKRLEARRQREAGVNTEEETVKEKVKETEQVDIAKQIAEAKKQRAIQSLQAAFESTKSRLGAEREALVPEFRQKESDIRTGSTLARAGADKFLQIGGLGQAGQVGQTETAQNVITQGAISNLNQQELAQRANIEQRLTEAQMLRDQGVANAETEFEILQLESQLRSQEAQAEYEREQNALIESREYDAYIRDVEQASELQLIQEKNRLEQQNTLLDAEIKEAMNTNDFEREKVLAQQKAQIDLQLEGIRQSGRLQLEGARSANTRSEIALRGAETRATNQAKAELEGTNRIDSPSLSTVNTAIKNAITSRYGEFSTTEEQNKTAALNWITANGDIFMNDVALLRDTLLQNGITERELEEFENMRDKALQAGVFE